MTLFIIIKALFSVIMHYVMLLQSYNTFLKINMQKRKLGQFFQKLPTLLLFTFLMCEGARDNKPFQKQHSATL